MGSYLNPGSDLFEMALRSQIFVDKSGLIEKNKSLCADTPAISVREPPETFRKVHGGGHAGCLL